MFKRFRRSEKGQGMVEYGLILALISMVSIATLGSIGGKINDTFDSVTLKDDEYLVTFQDDKVVIDTQVIKHGQDAVSPEDPTKVGRNFIGWDKEFANVTSDLTINALWDKKEYTVTFKDGISTLKTETVEYGETAKAPSNPTQVGKDFIGWDKKFINVTSDLTINAKWKAKTYEVTFIVHGSDNIVVTVEHGKDATPPTNPKRLGYTFLGWDKGYNKITGDETITAKWEIIMTEAEKKIDRLVAQGYIPISSADELNNIRNASSQKFGKGTRWEKNYTSGLDKKYILVSDLDLSEIYNFEPIGHTDVANSFTGTFDGGGYVISNLKINRGATDFVGLFGRASGATLRNIGLVDVNVTGGHNTGGLVGRQENSSTVTNSYATGTVTGGSRVGGLVGFQPSGSVSDSYATGNVIGTGDYIGGLVGHQQTNSSVSNSYYDKETTKQSDTGKGMGKSTVEMKKQDTYNGWNFESIWTIESGQYPTHR